jgi:uncharacterized protein YggE
MLAAHLAREYIGHVTTIGLMMIRPTEKNISCSLNSGRSTPAMPKFFTKEISTMHRSLIFSFLVANTLVASPIPDFPFTAVDGSARKEVSPDKATITFTVLCYDTNSEAAVTTVNKVLTEVVEGILGLGISKETLMAADLSKEAIREKGENDKLLKILGYNVSREVKIMLSEIKNYTAVARLIMVTDNTTRFSAEFDVSDRDEIEATLIAAACADAKKKAELLSKGVGANIGDAFAVSNQEFAGLPGRFGFGQSTFLCGIDSVLPSLGDGSEILLFVPAKIELQASVHVLYHLQW